MLEDENTASAGKEKILTLPFVLFAGIPILLAVLAVAGVIYWRWDADHNRGHHYGYWGQFNRTKNALKSLPGVRITKSLANEDITLEEFGFNIEVEGKPVLLRFGESDPIRKLKGDDLVAALSERIQAQKNTEVPSEAYDKL